MDPDEITRRAKKERERLEQSKDLPPPKPLNEKHPTSPFLDRAIKWFGISRRSESAMGFLLIFGCLFIYFYLTDEKSWELYIAIGLLGLFILAFFTFLLQKLIKRNRN